MYHSLNFIIWKVALRTQQLATSTGAVNTEPEHLLGVLVHALGPTPTLLFAELGVGPGDLASTLDANLALRQTGSAPATVNVSAAAAAAVGTPASTPNVLLSPRAECAPDYAHIESVLLGHERMGVEHLLLGLIREGEGQSARALAGHCITLGRARRAVARVKAGYCPAPVDREVTRMVTYN